MPEESRERRRVSRINTELYGQDNSRNAYEHFKLLMADCARLTPDATKVSPLVRHRALRRGVSCGIAGVLLVANANQIGPNNEIVLIPHFTLSRA